MKPFDLEKAKAGAKVITRCEYPVRILCFNRSSPHHPIVALISSDSREDIHSFTNEGKFYFEDGDSKRDLFMAPEKRYGAVWINNSGEMECTRTTHDSEETLTRAMWIHLGRTTFKTIEFEV